MKTLLMWMAVFAISAGACAQEPSLGEAARQNQEQKKAKRTFTNDDVNSGTIESVAAPTPATSTAPGGVTQGSASPDGAVPDPNTTAGDPAASQGKPDRSNFVGDAPGDNPEPKDRIETLKKHASQWDAMIANFEKKIAAETNPEKRDSLELMLEHARQNQAKDAAEQKSLEESEAQKANTEAGQPAAPESQTPQPQ